MKNILTVSAAAMFMILSQGAAQATNLAMPVMGGTSQPVGHYDFCKRYPDECGRNKSVGLVKLTRSAWDKIVDVNTR